MIDVLKTHQELPHFVTRSSIYDDCFKLYHEDSHKKLVHEFPFRMRYINEKAIDTGGVCRDFFSAFWEVCYVKDFDGGSTYVPVVHPHTDLTRYKVLGYILSHGFMSCGFIPNRLAFPVLAFVLLGCSVEIPSSIIIDSFIDYVSTYESSVFRDALNASKEGAATFSPELVNSLMAILGSMGCRENPTTRNIRQLITDVAKHELTVKPLGALFSFHSGVPNQYHPFWQKHFNVNSLYKLYKALSATPETVIRALFVPDDISANQSRVFGYLKTFIGNLNHQDLCNFLRFTTGSSVMIHDRISLTFNTESGLVRRPVSHTCSCILELSSTYLTYPDFEDEFLTVIRSEAAWPMDAI